MKYIFDKSSHSVYTLNYHLIMCIKYRRKVFITDAIIDDLKQRTKNIAENFGVNIINQECDIRPYTYPLFSKTFKPIWLNLSIV